MDLKTNNDAEHGGRIAGWIYEKRIGPAEPRVREGTGSRSELVFQARRC